MRITQATILFSLCLALFTGACWARGTTVSIGETVPLGGTTTATANATATTQGSGSSEPTPQMQITPADGSTPSSTEGSGWENLGIISGSGDGESGAQATGGSTASPAQNQQGGTTRASGCAPAFALAGMGLLLFASRK